MRVHKGDFVFILDEEGKRKTACGKARVLDYSLFKPGFVFIKFENGKVISLKHEMLERVWPDEIQFATPCGP